MAQHTRARSLSQIQQGWRFVFLQSAWSLGCLCCAELLSGTEAAQACLAGGISVVLPQMIFVALYFRKSGAQCARKIVNAFYLAEMMKVVMTVILIGGWMMWLKLKTPWFFFTLIGGYAAYIWAPFLMKFDTQVVK
jgi:F0F1-type ATP synthase assembly protein I